MDGLITDRLKPISRETVMGNTKRNSNGPPPGTRHGGGWEGGGGAGGRGGGGVGGHIGKRRGILGGTPSCHARRGARNMGNSTENDEGRV